MGAGGVGFRGQAVIGAGGARVTGRIHGGRAGGARLAGIVICPLEITLIKKLI